MLDQAAVVASLIILSMLSILLNSFCIYIIQHAKKFRSKPSSILLLNLLLTHLVQAIFVFPLYVAKKLKVSDLYWKGIVSSGFLFTYLLSFYSVCLGVLNISLDRFLATYLMMKYKEYVTFRNTLIVTLCSWLYVIFVCLIPFIPQSTASTTNVFGSVLVTNTSHLNLGKLDRLSTDYVKNIDLGEIKSMNGTKNMNISTKREKSGSRLRYYVPQREWTVFMLFFNAALPLAIIILCYLYVGFRLKKFSKSYNRQQKESSPSNTRMTLTTKSGKEKIKEFRRYSQVTTITIILTLTYSIFWSPSIVYYTVLSVCPEKCFPNRWNDSFAEKHIVFIIKFLSFLNSLFSPIIYCFRHPHIKEKLYKLRNGVTYRGSDESPEESVRFSIHNIRLATVVNSKQSSVKTSNNE